MHSDLTKKAALLEQSDEGSLHEISLLDSPIERASFLESYAPKRKTIKRETSVFARSSIFYGLSSQLIQVDVLPSLSARQITLRRCGQQEPLSFDEIYSESQLPNCKKIGEGVYGEVFMYKPPNEAPVVLKIIPIEGELLVNGEQQKGFDEILSEIVISMELSDLRNGKENSTDGFVNVKRVTCVKGVYPQHLLDEWEKFHDGRFSGSENDNPEIFDEDQLYIVFELCHAGIDLEAYVFKNAEEAYSIFLQVALTLAVAETKLQFEHRDLHWGNVLISKTTKKFAEYRIDGKVIQVPTHGVKATIIDYTLSRMVYDGAVFYDNLAKDEELFEQDGEGEYQFEIYRLMRDRVENDFRRFEPYTNLLWLHYLIDKFVDGARYQYTKSVKHKDALAKMMALRDDLLDDYQSASDFAKSFGV